MERLFPVSFDSALGPQSDDAALLDPFIDPDEVLPSALGHEEYSLSVSEGHIYNILSEIRGGMTSQSCGSESQVHLLFAMYCLRNAITYYEESGWRNSAKEISIPEGMQHVISYTVRSDDKEDKCSRHLEFFIYKDMAVRFDREPSGRAYIRVGALTEQEASSVLDELVDLWLLPPDEESDDRVEIGFWHQSSSGPKRYARMIDAPLLQEIKDNYAKSAQLELRRLVDIKSLTPDSGRIILMHGVVGSGKTTSLRALAREWRQWADFDVVIDPEVLMGDASYLLSVVAGSQNGSYSDEEEEERWKVLILEDSGELTRRDAKERTGQGLSRLLNLADGIVGRGMRVMFVITTNEALGDLHEAVIRPGRCLAQFEVPELSAEEATTWLGRKVSHPMSLANLFADKNADPVLVDNDSFQSMTGTYI